MEVHKSEMPRSAAVLLVNKLKGESCTPVPAAGPGASGKVSLQAGAVAGSKPRAHADPGTGLVLLHRLATMGVLSKTASDLGPAASPGLRWTLSTGLDTGSEGVVCLASHGWLAEWIRQEGAAVAALYGRGGGGAGESLCEYRVRVRGRLRAHQVKHMAAGPILKPGEQQASAQVLPPVYILAGRTVEDVEDAVRRAEGRKAEEVPAKRSRSTGAASGQRAGTGQADGKEDKKGDSETHNEWYTLRTDLASSRTLRQLLSSLGCPASRILRTRYGPWALSPVRHTQQHREPGASGNTSTKVKRGEGGSSAPPIPPGAALLLPVPRRVLLAAWDWAHGARAGKDGTATPLSPTAAPALARSLAQ